MPFGYIKKLLWLLGIKRCEYCHKLIFDKRSEACLDCCTDMVEQSYKDKESY